ncbi:hypothetical protein [Bordetella sp. FB-8]|uniref:hypothetical protein n=1 Tax=Bordetella sp. FB-8 TaxID=1159870 RepID=UPI00047680A9|nr:hypothetical protein [Bordetella sp. FB-8]
MGRFSNRADRQARIELLRTRAALERETLAGQLAQATQAWRPGMLLRMALSSLGFEKNGGWESLPSQLIALAKRHPVLGSALSSLLLGRIGSRGVLRAVTIGLAGWELYKAWRAGREPVIKDPVRPTSRRRASSRSRPSE